MSNKNLQNACKAKNDEFYTQITDIAKELQHYRKQFAGKTVFCNCDDPHKSGFFKYFALHFDFLGLKKLIATCYAGTPTATPHNIEITQTANHSTRLKGDGDFRSQECIEILKEADIVVTNPPFSLFREYVAQLVEYEKQFLIIGHQNAITYKNIFRLIRDNKLWIGCNNFDNSRFIMPSHYDITKSKYAYEEKGIKYGRVSGLRWYTNLDHKKRHENIALCKKYTAENYPKYDNYNAINVNKTHEIPEDYAGITGVPITFLDKYNPKQFEILAQMATTKIDEFNYGYPYVKGNRIYARILIKRKKAL